MVSYDLQLIITAVSSELYYLPSVTERKLQANHTVRSTFQITMLNLEAPDSLQKISIVLTLQ